jgi:AcrR family transcriptional regulator
MIYHVSRMPREAAISSRQEILRASARLFRERGYDATSMNDISAALKLSKGGLYHHFRSKDEILFHIMNHAMEITDERVLAPIRGIADPEERLRMLIRRHIELVVRARDREITVILHENHPLPGALRKRVNARKKDYIHFVENLIAQVQRARGSITTQPRAAAFALLGMINWIYQWYQPEGSLKEEDLVRQYTEIFFAGAFQ